MPQETGTPELIASPESTATGHQYMVVARRYRPQTFTELVGQDHVAQALSNAINNARVGHAYLFTGARGTGKTSTARIFAKALNCVQGPTPAPCNECDICRCISTGDDVDVIEIDGASNRGIDEIRELRSRVNVRPSRARFKIYIIDEVHMLTREAFNALLKTLEEPPEHVKFIFCTTEAEKIPITILSRCQRFDFLGVQPRQIADRLKQIATAENVEIDDDAVESLARRAAGSMRDSQSLLEQLFSFGGKHITLEDVHHLLGTANSERLGKLLECVIARDAAGALAELDHAMTEGVDLGQLLVQLVGYLRDVMIAAVGGSPEQFLYSNRSDISAVEQAAKSLGVNTLLAMMQILDQTMARLRVSTHGRILTELAIVGLCQLENLDELSAQIERVQQGLPATSPAPRAAHPNVSPQTRSAPAPSIPAKSAPASSAQAAVSTDATDLTNASPPSVAPRSTGTRTLANDAAPPVSDPSPAETQPAERAGTAAKKNGPPESQHPVVADKEALPAISAVDHREPGEVTSAGPNAQLGGAKQARPVGNSQQAMQLWRDALEQLPGLIGEQAACAKDVALAETGGASTASSAPITLVVTFEAQYNLYRRACEQPANTARIEQALTELANSPVRIRFTEVVTERKDTTPTPPVQNRQQRLSELAEHPLVMKAKELFGAKPVALSEPAPATTRE